MGEAAYCMGIVRGTPGKADLAVALFTSTAGHDRRKVGCNRVAKFKWAMANRMRGLETARTDAWPLAQGSAIVRSFVR